MTSSLVGSEMCIRDSCRDVATGLGLEQPGVAARDLRHGSPTPLGSIGAVSYTHLTLPTICSV
eukprot:9630494-Prorocentrum_lima.AAC.1